MPSELYISNTPETYIFSGPQGPSRKYGNNKGIMSQRRIQKRTEAEQRQKAYLLRKEGEQCTILSTESEE